MAEALAVPTATSPARLRLRRCVGDDAPAEAQSRQPDSFQVQVQVQVNGQGPWFPVTGTAETVSPAFAEAVVEARSRLVGEPLP